jgi:glyoxylase I family protein
MITYRQAIVWNGRLNHLTLLIMLATLLAAHAPTGQAATAKLTRHLADYQRSAEVDHFSDSFFATAGEGSLEVVTATTDLPITLSVNDKQLDLQLVAASDNAAKATVPVSLKAGAGNKVVVSFGAGSDASARIRITQSANIDFQFTHYITYAGNTFNFERSVDFYAQLGWTTKRGGFPKTNTPEMGHALGADGPYTMHDGALLILTYGNQPAWIDLLEWIDPKQDGPPYASINHLGMAHAAYVTTDIDADYAHLKTLGVEFLSAPVGNVGERFGRFVFLKDPDGTLIQLVQVPDEPDPKPCDAATDTACPVTHLTRPHHISVNVQDFVGAREYFRLLGFTESEPVPSTTTLEEAKAMGFAAEVEIIAEDISVPASVVDGGPAVAIRLQQWVNPYDDDPAYALPITHVGIQRLVMNSDAGDNTMNAKVDMLRSQGMRLVSPGAPCCNGPDSPGGLFLWEGPGGMFLETGGALTAP